MTRLRVLTNSERTAFACERHWWFSYIEGLTLGSPAPFRQGSLTHLCVEFWNRSNFAASVGEIVSEVIAPWRERSIARAEEADTEEAYDRQQEDELIAAETEGIMAGYIQHWAQDADLWEVVAIEPQLARFIINPQTGKPLCDYTTIKGKRVRRQWVYGGRIDRIMRRKSDGTLWHHETKTTGDRDFAKYCRKLHFDPQTRGYAWAQLDPIPTLLDPQLVNLGGFRIEGIVYDVIRKSVPTVPKPLSKCRHCGHPLSKHVSGGCNGSKACGCSLEEYQTAGLSSQELDTTRAVYRAAIDRHDLDPDDYVDELNALPGLEAFFHREEYSFSDQEIEEFGRDAAWHALQVRDAEKRPYHPRQTQVCHGFLSRGCPGGFESVCQADGPMTRALYQVKTIRHAELDGVLSDDMNGQREQTPAVNFKKSPIDHYYEDRQAEPPPNDAQLEDPYEEGNPDVDDDFWDNITDNTCDVCNERCPGCEDE